MFELRHRESRQIHRKFIAFCCTSFIFFPYFHRIFGGGTKALEPGTLRSLVILTGGTNNDFTFHFLLISAQF